MNNIYLVSRTDEVDYDEYDSEVVSAISEDEAREIHPEGEFDGLLYSAWVRYSEIDTLQVELIGTTHKPTGVILASFNAG